MWKEHYRIGSELHRFPAPGAFRQGRQLYPAVQEDGAWEERLEQVQATLEFMKEYVVIHFRDEEALQKEIGYPDWKSMPPSTTPLGRKSGPSPSGLNRKVLTRRRCRSRGQGDDLADHACG